MNISYSCGALVGAAQETQERETDPNVGNYENMHFMGVCKCLQFWYLKQINRTVSLLESILYNISEKSLEEGNLYDYLTFFLPISLHSPVIPGW